MILIPVLTALLLATAPGDQPAEVAGYVPSGSPVDLHDLGRLARLRDPRLEALSFGPRQRTSGERNPILAEVDGPGIIQRIWFARAEDDQPETRDRKNERVKIYLNGEAEPALDIPLETLFSGEHPHFPSPLVMEEPNGLVCHVPIGFRDGCKVLIEGEGVRPYQINVLSLPDGSEVEPFRPEPTPETAKELKRARALWSEPSKYESTALADLPVAIYEIDGVGNTEFTFVLPPGPATIQSIELEPAESTAEAWRSARLQLIWDQGTNGEPAVDLPVGVFFGALEGAISYSSLLVSQRDGAWRNRFPMPYRQRATLRIKSMKPIKGTFRVRFDRGIEADAGYLRADFRETSSTKSNEDFNWLNEQGRGHFAGILMWTQGKAKSRYWREGDVRLRIDGKLAIDETGIDGPFGGRRANGGRLNGPSRGFPIDQNPEEGPWRIAAYHWRVADPIPFAESIEADATHDGDGALEIDRRASVFWYSTEPSAGGGGR